LCFCDSYYVVSIFQRKKNLNYRRMTIRPSGDATDDRCHVGGGSFISTSGVEVRVFEELLDAEVLMNPAKLREAARQGIPSRFRGAVYRYLLGIASMDKSKEMTFEQMQEEDFLALEASYASIYGSDGRGGVGVGSGGSVGTGNVSSVVGSSKGPGRVVNSRATSTKSSSSKWDYCCEDEPLSVVGDAPAACAFSMVNRGGATAATTTHGGGASGSNVHSIQLLHLPPLLQSVNRVAHQSPWDAAFTRCSLQRNFRQTSAGTSAAAMGSSSSIALDGTQPHRFGQIQQQPDETDEVRRRKLESALRALRMKHPDVSHDQVNVIFSFASVFVGIGPTVSACDVYHLTEVLFSVQSSALNPLHSAQVLQEYCGTFLMLFHHTNAELYHHFHAEGVLPDAEWVLSYMRGLLSKQLHIDDFLRLLDSYLADCSETGGFPLHIFVCLSLLSMLTEDLMEMDRTQIIAFLGCLPRVDVEVLLQQALSVREAILSRELL
jgi:hypothetical protein